MSSKRRRKLRAALERCDDEMDTVQRIADQHLRGKLRGGVKEITLPLVDLLTITCIASSVQQDIRVTLDPFPAPRSCAKCGHRLSEHLDGECCEADATGNGYCGCRSSTRAKEEA